MAGKRIPRKAFTSAESEEMYAILSEIHSALSDKLRYNEEKILFYEWVWYTAIEDFLGRQDTEKKKKNYPKNL